MALTDEVTTRLSTERLRQLTNPGEATAATSVDTARLAAAAADAQAEFATVVGVAYDNSLAAHVGAGVEGVVYYLLLRAGNAAEGLRLAEERWYERLERLAAVNGRDRVTPLTTSERTPSADAPSGRETRPDFDKQFFEGIRPRAARDSRRLGLEVDD